MSGRMPQLSRCGQAVQQVVRAGFSVSNRRATRRSGKPSAVKKRPDASRALPDRRLKITMCESPDSGPPGRPGGLGATGCGVGRFAAAGPATLTASWPLKSAGGPSTITLGRVARAHRATDRRGPQPRCRAPGPPPWPPDPRPGPQGRPQSFPVLAISARSPRPGKSADRVATP